MNDFEIERKWLINNPISETEVRDLSKQILKISQWYDANGIRVRRTRVFSPNDFKLIEENWELTTKKEVRSGVRVENEKVISEEYLLSGNFKPVRVLEKNRYLVNEGGFYWVVDFITKGIEDLVIVEREYKSIDEFETSSEIPDRFGNAVDVTDDTKYKSMNLANHLDKRISS